MRQSNFDSHDAERPARRAGYAEMIALGALAAGSICAIVGMANCTRARTSNAAGDEPMDSSTVTAPHGDKLRGAVV